MSKACTFTFVFFVFSLKLFSQTLPVPRNIEAVYKKGTRNRSGEPGKAYWQNSADYLIHVSFNPDTRLISGEVEIKYNNNSPDTLKQVWFKVYPNLYKKGVQRSSNILPEDESDGLIIDTIIENNVVIPKAKLVINGTNMILGNQSIGPAKATTFTITYHYTLNKGSHVRTGEIEPGADFIAYFFPRIAVYDDIDGWNKFPYLGSQEFYNDFCHFDAYVTVPGNYVVWATGDLQNCNEVFTPGICSRLQNAEKEDKVITIIDSSDLAAANVTVQRDQNTWHYKAENVTDLVFAVSNHYLWKSTSLMVDPATGRRTRVDAVFNMKHKDYFDVIHFARRTVEAMSYIFPAWPYPYAHETVFDGLDQMEYPMMVNDNPLPNKEDVIELTDHEIFHTMFPFYMGINETKYGWMDEGWATIGEWIISPLIDSSIVDEYGVHPYETGAATEEDVPINTLTTQLGGTAMFLNSYPKPGFGYLYVKDLLGDSLFKKALHFYIKRWNGKHPMPYDFFNCMNKGSGRNLDWFWKRWFFDGGYPDLAITSVRPAGSGYDIVISSKGTKPVPVDLTLFFQDQTVQKLHRSVSVWEKGNSSISLHISTNKKAVRAVLGSTYVPDSYKADNVYTIKN